MHVMTITLTVSDEGSRDLTDFERNEIADVIKSRIAHAAMVVINKVDEDYELDYSIMGQYS